MFGNLSLAQYSLLSQAVASDCLSKVLTKKRSFVWTLSMTRGCKASNINVRKLMHNRTVHNTNIGAL